MSVDDTVKALKLTAKGKIFAKTKKESSDEQCLFKDTCSFTKYNAKIIKSSEAQDPLYGIEGPEVSDWSYERSSFGDEKENEDLNLDSNAIIDSTPPADESSPSLNLDRSSLNDSFMKAYDVEIDRRVLNYINKKKKDLDEKDKKIYEKHVNHVNMLCGKIRERLLRIEKEEAESEQAFLEELQNKQKQLKESHHSHAKLLDRKNVEAKSVIQEREAIRKKREQDSLKERIKKEFEEAENAERILSQLLSTFEFFDQLPPSTKNCSTIMKQILDRFASIFQKQELSVEDVSIATGLSSEAKKVLLLVRVQIDEVNKIEAEKKTELEDNKKQSELVISTPECDMAAAKTQYFKHLRILDDHEDSCNTFFENPEHKNLKHQLMKFVAELVEITSENNREILKCAIVKLNNFLKGDEIQVLSGEQRISIKNLPEAGLFFLNRLAKRLVDKGSVQSSSRPQVVFALASFAVNVWLQHPVFGDLLISNFVYRCPFVIPYFAERTSETDAEFYTLLGYTIKSNGQPESEAQYLTKMAGYITLFASVMVSCPVHSQNFYNHPYGIKHTWSWLAKVLSHSPVSGISAQILNSFLLVVGYDMGRVYGRQFKKLLEFIYLKYLPKIVKVSKVMTQVTQLSSLLEDALKTGSIKKPEGL